MAAEFFYEFVPLDDGSPNVNGIVKTYEAGTTTPKVTYPTYADAIAGTNPNATTFTLAADGVVTFWMDGAYKIDVQTSAGVSIAGWPKDNVNAAAVEAATSQSGFVNKLINGDLSIWQRNTTQSVAGYGSADRWQIALNGSTQVTSQITFTPGSSNSRYYAEIVVTSVANANNYVLWNQNIEDVTALQGKTVTISFTAWSNAARNIAIELTQRFGTGGAPSADVNGIGSQLVAITTTPTRYSVTVAIPSITGKTIGTTPFTSFTGFNIWLDAGASFNTRAASLGQQSGTFRFSDLQIQEGAEMTDFERRPPAIERTLCERYAIKLTSATMNAYLGTGQAYNANQAICTASLPTTMRAAPTISSSGFQATNAAGIGAGATVVSLSAFAGSIVGLNITVPGAFVAGNATVITCVPGGYLFCDSEI